MFYVRSSMRLTWYSSPEGVPDMAGMAHNIHLLERLLRQTQ